MWRDSSTSSADALHEIFLRQRLRRRHRHDGVFPGSLPISFGFGPLQLDDARRLRVDAEVERQLPAALGLQRSDDGAERRGCELGAHLPDEQQIGKRIVRFGVRPHDRPNQAPLLQIPQMVFAQARIHAQQIALPVVLLLEILGRLNARHAAEIVLADDRACRDLRPSAASGFFRRPGNPSAPTTTSVVFAVTSSAAEPPSRITSAWASLRPSDESLPVKTTT